MVLRGTNHEPQTGNQGGQRSVEPIGNHRVRFRQARENPNVSFVLQMFRDVVKQEPEGIDAQSGNLNELRLQRRYSLAARRVDVRFPLPSLHFAYSTPPTLKSTRASALFVVNAYLGFIRLLNAIRHG